MNTGKPYYKPLSRLSRIQILRAVIANPLITLGIHWAFQGLLVMDRTERVFKLLLDITLTALAALLLKTILPISWGLAGIVGFGWAHSINFLFNGQIMVVLKDLKRVHVSTEALDRYLNDLGQRINAEPSILWSAIYGSLVRAQWSHRSDLDIRLVRKPGLWNGGRACWFVMKERSRALVRRFPLDIYVLDDFSRLTRMREDEPPLRLK